jgi:hypothetical protein
MDTASDSEMIAATVYRDPLVVFAAQRFPAYFVSQFGIMGLGFD